MITIICIAGYIVMIMVTAILMRIYDELRDEVNPAGNEMYLACSIFWPLIWLVAIPYFLYKSLDKLITNIAKAVVERRNKEPEPIDMRGKRKDGDN